MNDEQIANIQISSNEASVILNNIFAHYKNPTSLIVSMLSAFQEQLNDEERYTDIKYINEITRICYTMLRTSANSSTYLKLIAPTSPLKPVKILLNDFLKKLLDSVRVAFADIKYSLEYEICPEQIITECDTEYLATAIFQLISNSCIFSPKEATINVTVTTNNNSVNIIIADEGDGIPTDSFEQVFTPFYTHSYQLQPEVEVGMGLGLPIVKQIATLMRGNVLVAAGKLGGTTVTINFPIVNTTSDTYSVNAGTSNYLKHSRSSMNVILSSILNTTYD